MTIEPIIIKAGQGAGQYWRDLWRYRELFYFLAWRDILVRYKQTFIGVAWSLLRPLLTMIVFTVVFDRVAKLPSQGVPYPLMVFVAMLPWQFFSNAFTESANSLVGSSNLLTKVYFPRLIIPSTSVIISLVDFGIAFLMLGLLMAWYQFLPGPALLLVLPLLIVALMVAFGAGVLISALNVRFRDFKHLVPFIVQFGLYISPVGFSAAVVPDKWKHIYYLNPMAGVIEGFRYAVLGSADPFLATGFWESLAVCLCLVWIGIKYFRATEQTFADHI